MPVNINYPGLSTVCAFRVVLTTRPNRWRARISICPGNIYAARHTEIIPTDRTRRLCIRRENFHRVKNDHEGSEETIRGQISANFFRQPFRGVNNESLSFSKMETTGGRPHRLNYLMAQKRMLAR